MIQSYSIMQRNGNPMAYGINLHSLIESIYAYLEGYSC